MNIAIINRPGGSTEEIPCPAWLTEEKFEEVMTLLKEAGWDVPSVCDIDDYKFLDDKNETQ